MVFTSWKAIYADSKSYPDIFVSGVGNNCGKKAIQKIVEKKTYHLELQINKSSKEQLKKESSFKTVSNLVLSRAVL